MRDFFLSRKFKIILCMLAVLVGIALYTVKESSSDPANSVISKIFAPFQKLSTSIKNGVENSLSVITNAKQNYDENIELRAKLDELYVQIIDYQKLKNENDQLRRVIGLKEDFPDFAFSPPCQIISKTANDPFGSFVIDKGTADGISVYDPVITDAGLVGIVTKASTTYSRVTTILSPEVPVGAYCIRNNTTGIVECDAELAAEGICRMKYIEKDSDLEVGDIIVTSGNSGLFPKDRIIGTVEEIYIEESGLSKTAIIKPIADIKEIQSVFIITSFNGQGESYEEE
jgi:rod shape-determining protein MreC